MMKSMKLMKSLFNNLTYTLASHACRALLFIALLWAGGNSAWAQTNLSGDMFKQWSSPNATATVTSNIGCSVTLNTSTTLVYGDANVNYLKYADLTGYTSLVINVTDGTPRLLFNREVPATSGTIDPNGGAYLEINSSSNRYVTVDGTQWTIDLRKLANENGYAHLNSFKGANYANVTVTSVTLTGSPLPRIEDLYQDKNENFVWLAGEEVPAGQVIFGDNSGGVPENQYADLSAYDKLIVTYDNTKALPRFLFNKSGGNTLIVEAVGDYMTIEDNTITIHLAKLASDNGGIAHLNCIKAPWGGNSNIIGARLENVDKPVTISKTIAVGSDNMIQMDGNLMCDYIPYNYILIELVKGDNTSRYLTPAANNQDMSQPVSYATFRVESQDGDKQNSYTRLEGDKFAYASYGGEHDGMIVSGSTFTFKLPDRYNYAGNHLKIHLSRYSDNSHGVNNPPVIEKTYDYMIWAAGNDADAEEHKVYAENNHTSAFDVNLYSLLDDGQDLVDLYPDKSSLTDFTSFYIRWYVADKVTHEPIADANGNPISMKTQVNGHNVLRPVSGDYVFPKFWIEDVGYFAWIGGSGATDFNTEDGAKKVLNVKVDLPNGLTQDDVEMVALVVDNLNGGGQNMEPKNLQHKFVVKFVEAAEIPYMDLPFRHYKGVTGRDWVTPEGSTGTMNQSIWTADGGYNKLLPTSVDNDPTAGSASGQTVDARQGVHTWEYDIYINPDDGPRALVLPFENYMYGYQTGISADGNDLEPRAYFRWYDWKTDKAVVDKTVDNTKHYTFEACNPDILKPYIETDYGNRNRGLVALNLDPSFPTQGRVGVWFTADDEFTLDNYPDGIDIACDVSKYSDGIVVFGTNAYLEHEPTLSMRYIFHIYPGKKIADELAAAKDNLSKARGVLENTTSVAEKLRIYTTLEYLSYTDAVEGEIQPMFALPEDEGRVVVSLGTGKTGNFSLRLDESLDNYKLWDGNNLVTADGVKWVAFYEDEKNGDVLRKEVLSSTNRIQSFSYSNFQGAYYPLGESTTTNVSDGMKFHVIGYATYGDVNTVLGTGVYAPVTHYELQFLVAPPLSVADLKNDANVRKTYVKRTDEYLAVHYDLHSVVDFDGNPDTNKNLIADPDRKRYFYSFLNGSGALDLGKTWDAAPSARENNMSWLPREWTDIEYSYCYPQLCDYVIDSREGYWCYNHYLSPFHGDYMILESMNMPGISNSRQSPYTLQWWWGSELHDYTYVTTGGSKSGSFLYTDASNESRTMVTIPFDAELCAGSSIYFTAAVADMTNAQIKPQLLIRIVGVDDDGNQSNVVSFHTCDINTAGAETGEWYQIYGESTIPVTFDDEINHFICEVVNYADNTNGADFAIDQFQIYTNTAKVKLSQDYGDCDDVNNNKTFIYAEAESIQALYGKTGSTDIYWRIHDEHGEVVTGAKMYSDADDGTSIYGAINIPLDYINHLKDGGGGVVVDETAVKANEGLHWYMGNDGKVYLKIANRYLSGLLDGQTYYVSIYDARYQLDPAIGFKPENNSYWGGLHTAARSKCSVFSQFFIPGQQYVIYYDVTSGMEGGYIMMECDKDPVVNNMSLRLKKPDLNEPSGFKDINGLHYDYFFGTIDQWASNDKFDATYTYKQLREAVQDYRATYPDDIGVNGSYSKVVDEVDYHDVLVAAITANKLELNRSTTFSNNFNTRPSKDFTVLCLPVEENIPETTAKICSPFVVKFNIVWPSPDLALGFSDVEYPNREGVHRVVRIGLEQLNDLRNNGYILHVPIHDYNDKDKNPNTGLIRFNGDYLTLSSVSDDPTAEGYTVGTTRFAKLVTPESGKDGEGGDKPFVDADHMFLALDLSDDNCQINFHEGYTYEVSAQIWDKGDEQETPCCSDIYLTIKVVPEYVTWDPKEIESDYYNANWNNDDNWNRSERAEMYMDDAVSHQQNTPTPWREDVTEGGTYYYGDKYYKNATEINAALSSGKAFVPMKFTHVTLPAGHAPSLITMDLVAYNTSPYTGGAILAGNLITDPSPYDPERKVNSPATPDILYDMLVRYTEKECQGHLQKDGTTVYGEGTANVYDCEKFYGNICKEIYFKPQAELLRQHRMTYEKAWVEKELVANKWYMLSAPLKNMYAGDMYVPVTMTDVSLTTPATVKGRQVSEAFQPISFNTTTYSRTGYPFYQRSWGIDAKVYTKTNDVRPSFYSGKLGYTTWSGNIAEWSHTYNDVQVPYNTLTGFSVRAHKKDQAENTLIRLPKADTSYGYYDWNDDTSTPAAGSGVTTVSKDYANRFVTDDQTNDGTLTFDIDDMQQVDDYVLVGNPFMASIDMKKFFETNTKIDQEGYWTYEASVASSHAKPTTTSEDGLIKPMQAFFVKKGTATQIIFDKGMQIDGNYPIHETPGGGARELMTMTAANDRGTSTASVELGDEEESVETLFDSNLSDVPMVYTVAGGQAVSINRVTELKPIAFGVTYNGEEAVDVTFSDIEQLTDGEVYVVDAVTGFSQTVHDGDAFSVQPNDYGRYFLVFADGTTGIDDISSVVDEVRKEYYDLRGHRVQTPRKGVYIVNGKKYLIK